MSPLSNPTPPMTTPGIRPFHFKRRKVSAVRSYPRNCGSLLKATVNSPSDNCIVDVDAARSTPEKFCATATITTPALTDSNCGAPPKIQCKHSSENCDSKSKILQNWKHRKFEAVRDFPPKCGPNLSAEVYTIERSKANMDLVVSPNNMDLVVESCGSKTNIPLNWKHRKVDAVRDFPPKCGATFSAEVSNDTSKENMGLVISPENIDLVTSPIAAVPIAAVPMQDFFIGEARGTTKDNKNKSLEDDMKELEESMAEAKNYLNDLDVCTVVAESELICDLKSDVVVIDADDDVCAAVAETEQICELESDVVVIDDDEPKANCENREELINLRIVGHEEPQGVKVAEALKVFAKYYDEIVKEQEKMKSKGERKVSNPHLEVAKRLKNEGKYVYNEWLFGHTPGIEIGDEFRFRSQLAVVGVHRVFISGIDHVSIRGKNYATSVVDSGRYENTATTNDVLIYSGQGGNLKIGDKSVDQKLEKGNLALMNSMEMGYPVRVTFKQKRLGCDPSVVYVYNGLYTVENAWQERDQLGKLVFKFKLQRMPDQSRSCQKANEMSSIKEKALIFRSMVEARKEEVCVIDDISQGKEKIAIQAMNGVDGNLPPNFTYVNHMVYQSWYRRVEPIGCDCVDGCSDSYQCTCVMKNGGELPYNENGCIMKATARIHECGPSCKCPPTCMNRISQFGPRYQLEIFKTKQKGWGVRSRDHIPSGGFVCEYIGEFLREKEADMRVDGDEYLFDVCKGPGGRGNGFCIDARVYGSIGRFFNHSCSPNMYAQKVIYDHDDHRMPRIVFYATEDIPPLKELCYHYNYKIGSVCDADGNVKTKDCSCGSRKCTKRLY